MFLLSSPERGSGWPVVRVAYAAAGTPDRRAPAWRAAVDSTATAPYRPFPQGELSKRSATVGRVVRLTAHTLLLKHFPSSGFRVSVDEPRSVCAPLKVEDRSPGRCTI